MGDAFKLITQSRAGCFRACRRRHWIEYELGMRPGMQSEALDVGSEFHRIMQAIDQGDEWSCKIADPFRRAMVEALVEGHVRYWDGADFGDVLETEVSFEIDVINPETGMPSRTWKHAGKIDRVIRGSNMRKRLWEYKTTSRDFSPGSDYWVSLVFDAQISWYFIAKRIMGDPVDQIWYDVTRRPGLRPLKATPEDKRYKLDGGLKANARENDEAPDQYKVRILEDMTERPDFYFLRKEIGRTEHDLAEAQAELWDQAKDIAEAQRTGRWYRNPSACFLPFKCAYLDICHRRDLDTVTPDGFVRLDDVHPELASAVEE